MTRFPRFFQLCILTTRTRLGVCGARGGFQDPQDGSGENDRIQRAPKMTTWTMRDLDPAGLDHVWWHVVLRAMRACTLWPAQGKGLGPPAGHSWLARCWLGPRENRIQRASKMALRIVGASFITAGFGNRGAFGIQVFSFPFCACCWGPTVALRVRRCLEACSSE